MTRKEFAEKLKLNHKFDDSMTGVLYAAWKKTGLTVEAWLGKEDVNINEQQERHTDRNTYLFSPAKKSAWVMEGDKAIFKFEDNEPQTAFYTNLSEDSLKNKYYKAIVYTCDKCQLSVMHLRPSENIGTEVHENSDQVTFVVKGKAKAIINDIEHLLNEGELVVIEAGNKHDIVNLSNAEPLKLMTIYSPPVDDAGEVVIVAEDEDERP